MQFIKELFSVNEILTVSIMGWFVAQVLKTIINFILLGKFQLERMWGDGGMPSAHSATVCAMVIAAARSGFRGLRWCAGLSRGEGGTPIRHASPKRFRRPCVRLLLRRGAASWRRPWNRTGRVWSHAPRAKLRSGGIIEAARTPCGQSSRRTWCGGCVYRVAFPALPMVSFYTGRE